VFSSWHMVQVQFSLDSIPPNIFGFLCLFVFLLLFTATVSIGMTTEMRSRETKKVNARRRRIPWRPAPMATRFLCSGCGISLKLSTGSAISEKVSSFYPIQLRTHTHRQTRKQQQQQQHMLKSGKRRYSMCTCVHLARGLRAVSTVTKGTEKL
jgi:hypothetical protein